MPTNNKVVWSEGMFLQPQHLQQQERYLESLVMQRPNYFGFHSYGFTRLEYNNHLLNLGKLAITRCRGIFPDGTAFNIPFDDAAPVPIDIPVGLTDSIAYLAIPAFRDGSNEISFVSDNKPFSRYFIEEHEVEDNHTNSTSITTLQIARLSMKLMLDHEDRGGYSCLPLLKIKESLADRIIKLDEKFLPPCLDIAAAPTLANLVPEILGLIHHRAETLIHSINEPGYGGASEIADFMLLQLLNRFEPLFEFFNSKKSLHPELLYIYLAQLMGELSTFTNKTRRATRTLPYDHDNLKNCFELVIRELRLSLSTVLQHSAVSLNLEQREHGIWVSPIIEREQLNDSTFILAVSANMSPETLNNQFIDQTKVASVETINSLISRALPGIDLQALPTVPRQIPFHSGYIYYMLNKKHPYWSELIHSGGIAIHIGNNFPELSLQLWAIKENN